MSDDRLRSIENKIDSLDIRLDKIDVSLVGMKKDLEYHIKRSDLLEKHVEITNKKIEPLNTHVSRVEGGLKLLGIISLILAIVGGISRLF